MARAARTSWLGAITGLSLLAVVAFVVGALAGLVWKEPGLLFAYLQGDTTEIAWTTASQRVVPADPPPVATSPPPAPGAVVAAASPPKPAPAPKAPARSQAPPRPAPKPAPAPPVAAAPPGSTIAVQVGAFAARDGAEALRGRLAQAGFPAYLTPGAREGDHWRVRVGPYPSREEADLVAARLQRGHKLPTWVLDEDAE